MNLVKKWNNLIIENWDYPHTSNEVIMHSVLKLHSSFENRCCYNDNGPAFSDGFLMEQLQ